MAFWNKKQAEFEEMDQVIREAPGIRPAELAQRLDLARSTVQRRLPSMEEAGYLYSEDERGGLWPFGHSN
jgi:DNA-binding IclR family transcriptional regulator